MKIERGPAREKLYPTRHVTIGAIIDADLRLHAFCNNARCHWHGDIDLSRFDRSDSSLPVDVVPRLVCSQCGGRDVSVVLAGCDVDEVPDRQADHWRGRRRPRDS